MKRFYPFFLLFLSAFTLFCSDNQNNRPREFVTPGSLLMAMALNGMLPSFSMPRDEDENEKNFAQAHKKMIATVQQHVNAHTPLDVQAILAQFRATSPTTDISEGTVYRQARDYATHCASKAKNKATGEDGSDEKMNAAQVKSEEEKELKFRQQVKWYDGESEAFMEALKGKKKS